MGRATALSTLAAAVAMGVAAPVLAAAGYTGVGIASIAAALAAAAVGATLPEHRVGRRGPAADHADDAVHHAAAFVDLLRTGARLVRSQPLVRSAVVLLVAVTAIWGSLDEYLPLLAVEAGATLTAVPLLGLTVYAGMSLGGLAAAAVSRLAPRGLAGLLLVSAGVLAGGSLSGTIAGFALITLAFGGFQALTVTADARLQAAIDGDARSTITSFAGFATEATVLGIFAAYAMGSAIAGHAILFALFAGLHLPVAAWLWRSRQWPARAR